MSIFSFEFIGLVLILVLLYFVLPKRWQWAILLAASVVFYVSGGLQGCLYILVTIVTQYFLGQALERRNVAMNQELTAEGLSGSDKRAIKKKYASSKKIFLLISLAINLGILAFLKLADPDRKSVV